MKVDGTRRRRFSPNAAKRSYYAASRQVRFARRFFGTDERPARGESTQQQPKRLNQTGANGI